MGKRSAGWRPYLVAFEFRVWGFGFGVLGLVFEGLAGGVGAEGFSGFDSNPQA